MSAHVETRPLVEADLEAAAALLARRHRGHRAAQRFLPGRFEDRDACRVGLADAWQTEGASGAVALSGGEVVGFLLGAPRGGSLWGPNVWVEAVGQAAEEPEVLRDLYGLAAGRWVDEGRTVHYVLVPAHDRAVLRAWCRLGFGEQQAHAVRPVPSMAERESRRPPSGVLVRPAARGDVPALARLDLELPRHQGASPVFSAGETPSLEEAVAEWEDDFGDEDLAAFVAEVDGDVVGSAVGCPASRSGAHSGIARPDDAGLLAFAAVLPSARGSGIGRALGLAVLDWAATRGFECVVTDWRTTNLLSSRAWPALGFEETFLRMHRVVGY